MWATLSICLRRLLRFMLSIWNSFRASGRKVISIKIIVKIVKIEQNGVVIEFYNLEKSSSISTEEEEKYRKSIRSLHLGSAILEQRDEEKKEEKKE